MPTEGDRQAIAAMLAWYQAMGVTDAVGEQPIDWLGGDHRLTPVQVLLDPNAPDGGSGRRGARSQVAPERSSREPARRPASVVGSPPATSRPQSGSDPVHETSSIAEAGSLARAATDLGALKSALEGFDGCPLKKTAKSLCMMRGVEQARLMVIGEGPGRDEDRAGIPFVGRAGQLLDRMLAAIGQSDETAHITNVVYWRPPGNRAPTEFEIMVCRPFLERQIELVDPDAILLLGGSAAKSILDVQTGIMKTRGKWHTVSLGGRERACIATCHPAYLLRTPAAKRLAWQDLLALQDKLGA
ncbi:MAG: uracil-DNA glycosylase [Pseudomonadota bacterium]